MAFRRQSAVLAIVLSFLGAGIGGQAAIATPVHISAAATWRSVRYGQITLKVPASWPVFDLARHPEICPRLNRHAVYLGEPGTDPACPAEVTGRTGAVQILPLSPGSPDSRTANRPAVINGITSRINSDDAVTHTIINVIPAAGLEVSLSYGSDLRTVREIQASIRISHAGRIADGRAAATAKPRSVPAVPAAAAQGLYQGAGFDTCAAPSVATMKAWLKSAYRAIGVYIGGVNRGCAQANLTSAWITRIQAQGWHYWPFYVGLQADCVDAFGDATIVASKAAAEGRSAAGDAAQQARNLGIPAGTPIVYDMEAYSGCGQQVVAFLSAWDSEIRADGYQAGVYESFSNVGDLVRAAGKIAEPNVINYADWDGKATTLSSYMQAGMWTNHQRLHQYLGGHNQTVGGATLNIDADQLDVTLGGTSTAPPPGPPGPPAPPLPPLPFKVAIGMNSNTTAEWFATAANGSVLHAWQHPIGSTSWSPYRTVGDSPRNLVSNPAVTSDQDGALTLFVVNRTGAVVHAWQQAGQPNDWEWGGAAGSGSPGRITGDPAAIGEPGGAVGVFVTTTRGIVMTTRQTTANANTSWSGWASVGGRCASAPVAFGASPLSVACTTTSGTLAVTSLVDGVWSAWEQAGTATGLAGAPAAAVTPAGQADLFARTAAGGIEEAYRTAGQAVWLQGGPLPGAAGRRARRRRSRGRAAESRSSVGWRAPRSVTRSAPARAQAAGPAGPAWARPCSAARPRGWMRRASRRRRS